MIKSVKVFLTSSINGNFAFNGSYHDNKTLSMPMSIKDSMEVTIKIQLTINGKFYATGPWYGVLAKICHTTFVKGSGSWSYNWSMRKPDSANRSTSNNAAMHIRGYSRLARVSDWGFSNLYSLADRSIAESRTISRVIHAAVTMVKGSISKCWLFVRISVLGQLRALFPLVASACLNNASFSRYLWHYFHFRVSFYGKTVYLEIEKKDR